MKNIHETIILFFQNEDIRKEFRELIKPIYNLFYNEIYIYIWFICIYHVFLIFIVLANLFILLRFLNNSSQTSIPNIHFFDNVLQPI